MYVIEYTSIFNNQFKKLMKKYNKSKEQFYDMFRRLERGELIGVRYNNLGLPDNEDVYKVMVANIDARRSAKNGFRLIYYVIKPDTIYLLTVYSKNETSNLKQNEIKKLIKKHCK